MMTSIAVIACHLWNCFCQHGSIWITLTYQTAALCVDIEPWSLATSDCYQYHRQYNPDTSSD